MPPTYVLIESHSVSVREDNFRHSTPKFQFPLRRPAVLAKLREETVTRADPNVDSLSHQVSPRRPWYPWAACGAIFLAAIVAVALATHSRPERDMAQRFRHIGVTQAGTLHPCPDTPNCVSSYGTPGERKLEPLAWKGKPGGALERLESIVARFPRTQVVTRGERYLHVEFRSRVFGFVDDVEFLVSPAENCIHFRSASRVGYSDLGVNAKRMAAIQKAWTKLSGSE